MLSKEYVNLAYLNVQPVRVVLLVRLAHKVHTLIPWLIILFASTATAIARAAIT